MSTSFIVPEAERKFLSRQARMSIEAGLAGKSIADIPQPPAEEFGPGSPLFRTLGAFVTLHISGNLRGCIGNIIGREPLYATVWHMAQAAAFADPRFPALSLSECPRVNLDISVLDELTVCPDPQAVEVGRHGLVLQYAGRSGVFLPQVPVEQGWDRLEYLDNLCLKAGLPLGSWQQPGALLFWYEAVVFKAAD